MRNINFIVCVKSTVISRSRQEKRKPNFAMSQRLRLAFEVRRAHAVDAAVRRALPRPEIQADTLLLLRLDAIGDYLLFRPFLRLLRESQHTTGKKITLLGNRLWRELAERWDSPYVDEFLWLDRRRFYEDPGYRYRFQKRLRQRGFETVLNTSYSRYLLFDDAIVRTCGAPERLGSQGNTENTIPKEKKKSDAYYSRLFAASPEVMFEFDRHDELFRQWLPDTREAPAFRPPEEFPISRQKPYAVLFPGASEAYRCWPVARFAEVGRWLYEEKGLLLFVAGGPAEQRLGQQLEALLPEVPLHNVVGKTNLPTLAQLIAQAEWLVSNETMAPHLAALYRTPTLCLSNGRHRGRFNPYPPHLSTCVHYVYPPRVREWLASGEPVTEDTFFYAKGEDITAIRSQAAIEALQAG